MPEYSSALRTGGSKVGVANLSSFFSCSTFILESVAQTSTMTRTTAAVSGPPRAFHCCIRLRIFVQSRW